MQVDRNSLSTQKSQLLAYAEAHGWTVANIFTDAGLSAKNTKRPAFQEMMKWAKDGRLDVILVSKLDRISRNMMDLLNLISDLKDWHVDFVSASQSFDTSTPMGMLILNMLGSFAQFEREMTGERVRENMRERAKKGAWSGVVPFGYRLNPETKLLNIEPLEAETVRAIYAEFLKHRTIRKTIHTINAERKFKRDGKPWAMTSIKRLLSSPTYTGTTAYGKRRVRGSRYVPQDRDEWVVVKDACEPIIEKRVFDEVQESLARNGHGRSWSEMSPHLLSGMVRCGICGGGMHGMTLPGKKAHWSSQTYYRCTTRQTKGPSVCPGLSIRADKIENLVLDQIVGFDVETLKQELRAAKEEAIHQAVPTAKRRKRLEGEFEAVRGRELRVLELYEEGGIDLAGFKQRRKDLDEQKLALAKQIAELESTAVNGSPEEVDTDALAVRFCNLKETFDYLSMVEKRQMLRAMIYEIVAYPDKDPVLDFSVGGGMFKIGATPETPRDAVELAAGAQ
jgi:site-specific DNA recombinase